MSTNPADKLQQEVLVVLAQAGNTEAFTRLVDDHHGRLLYFVRRLLQDRAAADDVLQETWVTAYRGLWSLREPSAFTAWLYGIARRKALQQLDRHAVRYAPTEALADIEQPAEQEALLQEDVHLLHRCLEQLSIEHREVLTLRFLEDMSYEQMAEVIGCQIGTIRSRLHYAKQALRRTMEQEEYSDETR